MSIYSDQNVQEISGELRQSTWGHGAFGEVERYDPSPRDFAIANLLDELIVLRREAKQRAVGG